MLEARESRIASSVGPRLLLVSSETMHKHNTAEKMSASELKAGES